MPAHAEIVLEGEMIEGDNGARKGRSASSPAITPRARASSRSSQVKRVYYRNDPILGIASPMRPPSDFSFSKCVMKAGMIWDEVERAGLSGVAGVWVHEFGGARMFNVIAIKQAYPGHARQAGLLAAGCQSASYLGRFVVVVDDDVDPTDLFDVMWAMCTRCDPGAGHRLHPPRLVAGRSIRCWTRRARPIRAPSSTPAGRSSGSRSFRASRAPAPSWRRR